MQLAVNPAGFPLQAEPIAMTLRGWLLPLLVLVGLGCARSDGIAEHSRHGGRERRVARSHVGRVAINNVHTHGSDPGATGTKVTGVLSVRGQKTSIEGAVRGERRSPVAMPDGRVKAELTVMGDEMSGHGVNMATMSRQVNVTLKRQP